MVLFYIMLFVVLMIFAPVVLGCLGNRMGFRWSTFLLGAGAFVISQAVHLPLNHLLQEWGIMAGQGFLSGPDLWRTALVGGLTAGLCEETARWGAYRIMKRHRVEDGVMLGIGHGGIESMLFGGVVTAATAASLFDLRGMDLASLGMTPDQLQVVTLQMNAVFNQPWTIGFAWVERLIAIALHVSLSLLVWKSVVEQKPLLVVAAVAYHMMVDFVVVIAANSVLIHWQANLLFLIVSLPMILVALRWWRKDRPEAVEREKGQTATAFRAALRKELLEQMRTRRMLIALSVFAALGIMSPLLARFMPEIIGSIEEARPFADLIPTPTAADSYTQYIKNISQFGFIMVLLLGMTAVAGEHERGTAALILSKPMPRAVFVISKIMVQSAVYIAGFLLGGGFAFGYTWMLFGLQPAGPFILINVLLVLWLLAFAGVTVVGSALAKSTGAAAGIGMVGVLLIFAAGGVPAVGQWAPGGLVVWANQIAANGDTASNGGAAALAVVIITLSVIGSIAALERKEV